MKTDSGILEDLVHKLARLVPADVGVLRKDMEDNIRAVLQSTFHKLDLVTREEFDLHAELLVRTREKLEAMEKKLTEIEKPKKSQHK